MYALGASVQRSISGEAPLRSKRQPNGAVRIVAFREDNNVQRAGKKLQQSAKAQGSKLQRQGSGQQVAAARLRAASCSGRDGAILDDLASTLHKRLNGSLSTFSIAKLSLLGLLLTPLSQSVLRGSNGADVLNINGLLILGLGVFVQLYVASVNYAHNSPEGYDPGADVKSWLNDAANIFTGTNGIMSTSHALLTAATLGAGLAYIVAPFPTLLGVFGSSAGQAGPDNMILWQLIGSGVSMLVAPATLSLKEAAANNILSDTHYKLLNIGLFTAGAGHLIILGPRFGDSATAGPLLPLILGMWGAAAALGAVKLFQSSKRRGEY